MDTQTIILTPQHALTVTVNTAMVLTLMDLTKEFSPTLAYTCSDELTLVFPPNDAKTVVYGVLLSTCDVRRATCPLVQRIHGDATMQAAGVLS